jgi:hypothetical protein
MKGLKEKIDFLNPVKVQCFDKDGNLKWEEEVFNGIVDEGIHYLLDAGFNGGTQDTTHYVGLVDNSGFTAFDNADTMSSHSGWSENTSYDESTRVAWNPDAAASRAVTNSTTVDFTMNATATIKGIFVSSDSTKSGTTGTLWATAAFSSNASVVSGDVLKVTYTVSG